ncbi:MAG TPA: hypothetical protein VHP11_16800 [Tepidisphaeraceae bacterium]|nr:hypothetical protein [Tepidisphaeraceae bacterium]
MRNMILALASVLFSVAPLAHATLLATSPQIPFQMDFPALPVYDSVSNVFTFQLCYMTGDPDSGILSPRTDTMILDHPRLEWNTEYPVTYTATAANDRQFPAFAALFTNGQNDWLSGQAVYHASDRLDDEAIVIPSTVFSESWLRSPRTADFAPYNLTVVTVSVYIDEITPRHQPLPQLVPVHVEGHAILTFEGTSVPEPASLTALAGLLALLPRPRRRA